MAKESNSGLQGALDLLVLRSLESCGRMHGYGITLHIQSRSEEVLRIEEGSLYPALHRMEQAGWIRAEWAPARTIGGLATTPSLLRGGSSSPPNRNDGWLSPAQLPDFCSTREANVMFWTRVWNLVRSHRHSSELDEELRFHVEMRSRDNVRAGMAPAAAERDARVRFGNLTVQKERTRDVSIWSGMDSLVQDARYTLRSLRGSRGVSALIVVLLTLGIGANTAIFSIAHAVLIRALPVKDPAGLVNLRVGNFMSSGVIEEDDTLTYALWKEVLERQQELTGIFAYADANFDVVLNGATKQTAGAFATSQAFRTLGIEAIAGRTFGPADERSAAAEPVVVISYELWNRAFAADPAAIGRTLPIEGKPFSIVGVTPPRFFGLTVGREADVYIPLDAEPYLRGKSLRSRTPSDIGLLSSPGFGQA